MGTGTRLGTGLLLTLVLSACSGTTPPNDVQDVATDSTDASQDVIESDTSDVVIPTDTAPPPPPPVELGRHNVTVMDTRQMIPGTGLPAETVPLNSNNNLDVIRHSDGRIYLAWRTGPDHFASANTVIHVVSSTDERNWEFEASFRAGTDLREPRFLSLNGSLFLYLARLGTDRFQFQPMGMSVTQRRGARDWTALEPFYQPGFIPWRARVERGTPYLTTYVGGEHIYQLDGIPLEVQLLTTTDGRNFQGVNMAMPTVLRGGASETDFTIGDDGTLFAVARNEAGDSTGWGSYVCRAPAGDITRWNCRNDPRKYDSPLMFWYDGEAYLIGRRNLTATGNYDLNLRSMNYASQAFRYQSDYSNRPKRCSLWRYDQSSDRIVYILDLPSRGDTCFPSILSGSQAGEFVVYNYSSPVDGPEVTWSVGQAGETRIYRHVLRFTAR